MKHVILAVWCLFTVSFSYSQILPGAYAISRYLPVLKDKKVGVVANHSSVVEHTHLIDTLLKSGIRVIRIFSPEHGFRGNAEAGQKVKNEKDPKTGIPIISLYGKHYKPTASDLSQIDIVIFDIQDVGVRFYTYLSTLHYVMEACAENNIPLIVLDRPNPNGFYIDGPVLDLKFKSFVGLHPVPVVYGMTIGEYALMINGEKWLKNQLSCNLTVIPCTNYKHSEKVNLTIPPSPNLQNMQAIYLYPSLALFEGTVISVGRGTDKPFMCFGHPKLDTGNFFFKPKSNHISISPLYVDTLCRGFDLSHYNWNDSTTYFSLKWVMIAYQYFPEKNKFFNRFFYNLSGNYALRNQIEMGISEDSIRQSWQTDLIKFKEIRKKYLLYE